MSRCAPLVVSALLGVSPAAAQDPVKVDPAHHKVELENAHVRVLRISFGPGEKAPVHEHPAAVAVFLTDHQATVVPAEGTADPAPRKRGDAIIAAPSKHTIENRGTERSEVVLVEIKAPAPAMTLAPDALKADPKRYSVIAEDDRVRVLRIKYGPKEKSVLHQHWPGAAVMLTDGSTRMTDASGKSADMQNKAGDVGEQTGDAHLPENLADRPFEVVLVEVKPARR